MEHHLAASTAGFAGWAKSKKERIDEFTMSLALDLAGLRTLRRRLGAWLDEAATPTEHRDDIILATHEAAANAIEHADLGSEVTVRGAREEDTVVVVVANAGRWRSPARAETRGRGLAIIRALMSSVETHQGTGRVVVRMTRELS